MTIGTPNRNDYLGNGATATYSFGFKIFAATDLHVTRRDTDDVETELSYPTHYSVSAAPWTSGGTITLVAGVLASGYRLSIRRVRPLTQTTDFRNQSSFFAETHESQFDDLVMIDQQQQDEVDRSLKLPESVSPLTFNPTLPVPVAGKAIGWDVEGLALVNYNTSLITIETLDALNATFLQAGNGAVTRNVRDKLRDVVSVFDFMTAPQIADVRSRTSALDVTAAIQATIDAVGTCGDVSFPRGRYLVTATLFVKLDRVHLRGAGKWASQILFTPTAHDTCLMISKVANEDILQGSVCGLGFYSANATYTKVAIDGVRVSEYGFNDIVVHGSVADVAGTSTLWSGGAGSIGIRLNGHEFVDVGPVSLFCDAPIRFAKHPTFNLIDHFHFHDLYMIGNTGFSLVEVEDGTVIQHLLFDGLQAWVSGDDGFRWVDTLGVAAMPMVAFHNVGREQVKSLSAYTIRISFVGGVIQNFRLNNFYGPTINEGGGFYLRNITGATLDNLFYIGDGVALNANSSCTGFNVKNFNYNANGGTLSVAGLVSVRFEQNGKVAFGTFDVTEQVNLPNDKYIGFRKTTAATVKAIGLDAGDVLRINKGETGPVYVDGTLNINTAVPNSHRIAVANGQIYAGGNAAASGTIGIASISGTDHVSIAPTGVITDFGGYIGGFNGTATGIRNGSGTPEGVVTAIPGSLFLRANPGGPSEVLYVKEGGVGNTGWVAK